MGVPEIKPPGVQMPPPSAHPPTLGSANAVAAANTARERAVLAEGKGSNDTVKTSQQGLKAPDTGKATLLGG